MKISKIHSVIAFSLLLTLVGCGGGSEEDDQPRTCSEFKTQFEAQKVFLDGALELDADHDGIACEHLPKY